MTQIQATESFKQYVKGLLNDESVSEVCIIFTKKDGTERKMFCTLIESRIPEADHPKESNTVYTDEAVRVYDTEALGWRSFRWDSVKEVRFKIG